MDDAKFEDFALTSIEVADDQLIGRFDVSAPGVEVHLSLGTAISVRPSQAEMGRKLTALRASMWHSLRLCLEGQGSLIKPVAQSVALKEAA